MDKQEFIKAIAGYVAKYARAYGILVHSPIIAQAILESAWGKSKLAAVYREKRKPFHYGRVHTGNPYTD